MGPIERIDCWNYDDLEECKISAEKLAKEYHVKYLP